MNIKEISLKWSFKPESLAAQHFQLISVNYQGDIKEMSVSHK